MTYEETLKKIHSFERFGSRLGLERMNVLMHMLGDPQNYLKVIHVAGTNGKGSVCRYLYSVLQENGYKTGLYTSPYLERFTERIVFDGKEISGDDLARVAEKVFAAVDQMLAEGHESPTEFEVVTAIAFCYFAEQPIDYVVLEVGLGGIGDSTNVVPAPLLSVITSIALDHTNVLGRRLEWIAEEKAGIIKHGCPVLVNIKDKKAKETVKKIAKKQTAEFFDASAWSFGNVDKSLDGYRFDLKRPKAFGGDSVSVSLSMMGMHQVENALTAMAALDILQKNESVELSSAKVLSGMKAAVQPGRFEILRKDPYVIIDGAHNPNGAAALEETLEDLFRYKKVLVITGILQDKDGMGLVECFSRMSNYVVATEPNNPRKLDSVALANLYRRNFRECEDISDWKEACRYAQENMDYFDAILFAGSLYLIGDVRGAWDHDTGKGFTGL